MRLFDHVSRAAGNLTEAGIPAAQASRDAELLARHALGWDTARFLANRRDEAPDGFETNYDRLVDRRRRREPPAYILGSREFWGLDFEVTPDVLIPRPDSEFIVEEALAVSAASEPLRIIDVGTGSGCLAVSLAREFPAARVTATDISAGALIVARRNAARHGVRSRVWFVQTDLLAGVGQVADLIVANPPYVASVSEPALQPEVRDHEPAVALYGGHDGLDAVARLTTEAARCLHPDGHLICEFGFGQEDAVVDLFARGGWRVERVRLDLQGIPRVVVAKR
jgi:release factor glutamine methyltransferase